jgi:hypothetical protein
MSANNANAIGGFGCEGLFRRARRTRGWLWWRRWVHDDKVRFWLRRFFFVKEEKGDANNIVVLVMTKMVRMGNFASGAVWECRPDDGRLPSVHVNAIVGDS